MTKTPDLVPARKTFAQGLASRRREVSARIAGRLRDSATLLAMMASGEAKLSRAALGAIAKALAANAGEVEVLGGGAGAGEDDAPETAVVAWRAAA